MGNPYTLPILNGGIAQPIIIPAADPGAGGAVYDLEFPVTVSAGTNYYILLQRVVAGSFVVRYRNANIDPSIYTYWDLTGFTDWDSEFTASGCAF